MGDKIISEEFRMFSIGETRNYFIEEIDLNNMMSKKIQKNCKTWIILSTYLLLSSVVTTCVLISAFASLAGIPIRITGSVVVLRTCAITTGIKKTEKKHGKCSIVSKN